jgi:hypothetical protein
MTEVRLPFIPATNNRLPDILLEKTGLSAVFSNGEWVCPMGSNLRMPPILELHSRMELIPENFSEIAAKLVATIPDDLEAGRPDIRSVLPDGVDIIGTLGVQSELKRWLLETMIAPLSSVPEILERHLLPLMVDEFNARYVAPISLQASRQQSFFSTAKTAVLIERFGYEEAKRLLLERSVFQGIEMTAGIELLSFVDALTRLFPLAFSLPVHRAGVSWQFYSDRPFIFQRGSEKGLYQEFIMGTSPRIDSSSSLVGLGDPSEKEIWQMLRQAVDGLNALMAHLNDWRTFLREDRTVDFLEQLRAYGSIFAFFSDVLAMNYSREPHSQATFMFGAIDKLANFKAGMTGLSDREEQGIANEIVDLETGKELKRIINDDIGELRPELAKALLPIVGRCYGNLHRSLGRDMEDGRGDGTQRAKRFRSLRNINHGAFLRGNQFHDLFVTGQGVVPPAVGVLPFLLALGLTTSPKRFIQYRPLK